MEMYFPIAIKTNLFLLMESERAKVPNILREDYAPIFVVNLLRKQLEGSGDDEMDLNTLQFSARLQITKNDPDPKLNSNNTELTQNQWTDDSVLEEVVDYEGCYLLNLDIHLAVQQILNFTRDILNKFDIDRRKFCAYFAQEIEYPCLELLWALDALYNLLDISSYLMHLKHKPQIDHFVKQFVSFCFSPSLFDKNTKAKTTRMLNHLLQTILISSYCNPTGNKALENLQTISDDILLQITERLLSDDVVSCSFKNHQFLIAIIQDVPLPNSVKCRYFSHQLSQILTCKSGIIPKDPTEILQQQEKFADPSENLSKSDTLSMMTAYPQTSKDLAEIVEKSLQSSQVDWENLLLVITEWVKCKEYEAISLVREMIKTLMSHGLCAECGHEVISAFILARHCSLIAPKVFSRYEKWYKNMFDSDVYSPAKDPQAFNFLANLLTKWIPLEPPCFLQVQATFWPYIPPGYRNVWSDYVSLAKVRIVEYDEVEGAMEFEPNPNNPLQYDVEMAIKAYDKTKKIPLTIAQMWMFRKQYYLDQFLPTLLRKPIGETLTDARLRLIEALNKEGKIPLDLYVGYKSKKS